MGKGGGLMVMPMCTGVKDDMEDLWNLFRERASLRFKDAFQPCFLYKRMSLIYSGRPHEAELREFEEKILSMALQYILPGLSGETNIQREVFGIYLLYSLYVCQPAPYQMKIRVTTDQYAKLLAIKRLNQRTGQTDVAFVILKMIAMKAFHITCFANEYNPLTHKTYEKGETYHSNMNSANEVVNEGNVFDNIVEDPHNAACLEEADAVFEKYVALKKKLAMGKFYSELNVCSTSYPNVIRAVATDCTRKIHEKLGKQTVEEVSSDDMHLENQRSVVKDRRAAIRQRAYGTVARQSKHRRHRQESQGTLVDSPTKQHNTSPVKDGVNDHHHTFHSPHGKGKKRKSPRKATKSKEVIDESGDGLQVHSHTKRKTTKKRAKNSSKSPDPCVIDLEPSESHPKEPPRRQKPKKHRAPKQRGRPRLNDVQD